MKNFNYLRGFDSFANIYQVNEMASNLMSIPEFKKRPELMRFIHSLSSELVARGSGAAGLRRGGKFRTQQQDSTRPGGYFGGDWPEHQDFRLSHDVAVKGEKTGKERIYQWLDNLDKKKDTDPHAILVSPDPVAPQIWYLTKKTGTLSPAERIQMFGTEDRSAAWEKGVSVKAGYFMRAITIDAETGEPIASWTGTLGQLMDHVSEDSVLYIMEDERRAVEKAEKRKKEAEFGRDKFFEYFKNDYIKVLNKAWEKRTGKRKEEWEKLRSEISPEEFMGAGDSTRISEMSPKLQELFTKAQEIQAGGFDAGNLAIYCDNWLEYMATAGNYKLRSANYWDKQADLLDVIKKHTLMGACNRFLQFITTGKIAGPHLDALKELGIDTESEGDLNLGDLDLSDIDL